MPFASPVALRSAWVAVMLASGGTVAQEEAARDDEVIEVEDDGDEGRRYASLEEAFRERWTPSVNRQLVRRIVERIPIRAYFERGSYIKAVRSDGGPDLRFWYGFTNGFTSEAEAIDASGGQEPWASPGRRGLYGINHPVRGSGSDGGPSRGGTPKKNAAICPNCGDQLALSGECSNPDCPTNN